MSIVAGTRPDAGDALRKEHAAVPAGALEGELYVVDPTVASSEADGGAGGLIGAGTFRYKYTWCVRDPVSDAILGESLPSPASTGVTIAASHSINVSAIAVSTNAHVNARRLYRSIGGGTYERIATITDNTTTTYADNNTSTTAIAAPSANSTGQNITVNLPVAADAFKIQEAGVTKLQLTSKGDARSGPLISVMQRTAGSVAVSNTTTETEVLAYQIEGGTFGTTGGIRIQLRGRMLYNTAANLRFKIIADTPISQVYVDTECPSSLLTTNANYQAVFWEFFFLNNASVTSKWIYQRIAVGPPISGGSWTGVPLNLSTNANHSLIDTTTTHNVSMRINWSTASASLDFRREAVIVEKISPA